MRRLPPMILLLVCAFLLRPAASVPMPALIDEQIDECGRALDEPVPYAVHVPVVEQGNNNDDLVDLDVYLVGDRGVTRSQARAVMRAARESFDPLNIRLREAGFKRVRLSGDDALEIIDQTKALFARDRRPKGSDVVWTMTTVDLTAPGFGSAVAGIAACIGGVRYPDYAFLAGEYSGTDGFGLSPLWFYGNLDAKVFAHETGHLLGAHHHYANCAQGVTTEVGLERIEGSPCTLMTNFADFISINFGLAEGLVVRAHAEEFARP